MSKEQSEELLATYVEKGLRIRIALDLAVGWLEKIQSAEGRHVEMADWALVEIREVLEGVDTELGGE